MKMREFQPGKHPKGPPGILNMGYMEKMPDYLDGMGNRQCPLDPVLGGLVQKNYGKADADEDKDLRFQMISVRKLRIDSPR